MPFPFRARRARFGVLLAAACLTAVAGCSDGNGDGSASSPTPSSSSSSTPSADSKPKLTLAHCRVMPARHTVRAGARVVVTNSDTTAHTVTADTASDFDTGTIAAGRTVSFAAPSEPGTYPYACTIHPFMKATLVVR
jgi:plastocyanin